MEVSKNLMRDLLTGLRSYDRFNILFFAGGSQVLAEESLTATSANINKAIHMMNSHRGGGGTNLLPALNRALELPRASENLSRSVVIVTDGYVSVEKEAFEIIRNNLNQTNVYAFGIGKSINRYLIEGLASVGQGEPLIVTKQDEAPQKAEAFRDYISKPVLTQINTRFKGFEAYDVEPITVPDVLATRPILIYGKWRGDAEGKITLPGRTGKGGFKASFDVAEVAPDARNSALRYLWAREKIRMLDDYSQIQNSPEIIKEVTDLGLQYNLMTAYTSFLAVDERIVVEKDETVASVKQPLPMPSGVSNSAIGYQSAPSYAVGFDFSIENIVRRRPKTTPESPQLVVESIQSSLRGHAATQFNNQLNTQLPTLLQCFQEQAYLTAGGRFTIDLVLDSSGRVIGLKIIDKIDPSIVNCMRFSLRGVEFKDLNLRKSTTLRITFQL